MWPLEPGDPRTIGEYRLLRRIGSGGMGRVYLGRSASGRTVAVKVVHPHFCENAQFRERFRREVAAARRVAAALPGGAGECTGGAGADGTWTAPVLDADPDARVPWVVTGYVAGPPLQQAVAEHGPLPEAPVRALGAGLAEALRHVHGLGLVHRDVKPSNVLLTLDGPRLIDFGIARATDGTASLTSTGVSIGSPGYMSPEQVLGKGVTGASDVFSLGAVLAYAATGAAPFPGDSSASLLYKVVHEEPELDGLGGELRALISACLAKEAADRPRPADLAARLTGGAPGGAADLVRAGRLPGPLVEQVSRRAVELLNLEPLEPPGPQRSPEPPEPPEPLEPVGAAPQPPPGTGSGPVSGPVPFTHGAQGPAAEQDPYGGPGPGAATGTAAPAAPAAPGVAVSVGSGRRGRRLSCTVVLSVACALALLTIGGFVFRLFPGTGGGDTAGRPPAASKSPPQDDDAGAVGGSGEDPGEGDGHKSDAAVPGGFLGTWKGELYMDSGIRNGTLEVTITQGGPGETVATGDVTLYGQSCPGNWELTGASRTRLTTDATGGSHSALCSDGGEEEVFTLRKDGTLRYESHDPSGGNAAGTLKKTGS